MAQDVGGFLRGHVPLFHGSILTSGVELISILGKENRFHSATMAVEKAQKGSARAGQVPQPDRVIETTTGQPQAIGRECQITDHPLVTGKVSNRGAVGETPYPDVT